MIRVNYEYHIREVRLANGSVSYEVWSRSICGTWPYWMCMYRSLRSLKLAQRHVKMLEGRNVISSRVVQ